MNALSLYNITDELDALESLLEMDQGEITDDHQELIDQVNSMISSKTDSVVGFSQYLEDQIKNAKAKKDEVSQFIRVRENAIKRLKDYVGNCLDKSGEKSFSGELYEIKERKPSKVLSIQNEDQVPVEFTTVETVVKIDKARLKKAVQSGDVDIDGISIIDGARSIQFKTKSLKK